MSFVTAVAQIICRKTISLINQHPKIYTRLPALNNSSCKNLKDPQYVYSLINVTTFTIAIVGGLIALYLNSKDKPRITSLITKTTVFCAAISLLSIVLTEYYGLNAKKEPCFE